MEFKSILEEKDDCWGIGDGCLIDFLGKKDPKTGFYAEVSDNEAEAIIAKYIGTEVTVVNHSDVFAYDGRYLGDYYI